VDALRGIELALEPDEMVAIMGPSRLRQDDPPQLPVRLDSIDGGDVLIEGTSLSAMSDRERTDYCARRMGFVFHPGSA
jgi:ABC-type lipoprotein export system ATPase subunit